ncbi:hypothetical protein E2C01_073212 [Portunus trituberculatus]|uniref:Uncharacterized protein n=1 Tax=Portunus trituberculatus TaxID=210409 RepID=A0A5B7I993_PORTR|nr:hypothetical protein [Portunus trituberculatus]
MDKTNTSSQTTCARVLRPGSPPRTAIVRGEVMGVGRAGCEPARGVTGAKARTRSRKMNEGSHSGYSIILAVLVVAGRRPSSPCAAGQAKKSRGRR